MPKLAPTVYRAIIDKAHSRGMQVVAHIGTASALQDAKDLLRAGIDGFAHTVRDQDIDADYMALVRSYPDVWTIPNLPGSPVTSEDLPWLGETLPPFEVNALAQKIAQRGSDPDDQFQLQCRNLRRNREAEMVIGMGTDSGTSVAWTTHIELRDMVSCGLSPMEAIVAATYTNARILGLDEQLGMVAVGKNASFIVLDGEPLTDVNHTRRIVDVYLDGNRVDREALRTSFMANTLPWRARDDDALSERTGRAQRRSTKPRRDRTDRPNVATMPAPGLRAKKPQREIHALGLRNSVSRPKYARRTPQSGTSIDNALACRGPQP